MKKYLSIITFIIAIIYNSKPQSLSVFDINTTQFPTIKAKFFVYDSNLKIVKNLTPNEFIVVEDSIKRNILSVTCPIDKQPISISSTLVIDASGSMSDPTYNNIDLAKAAATAWIDALDLTQNDCAITSFNGLSFINLDFSQDKQKLLDKINSIFTDDGTDYNAAFISYPSSAIPIAKAGKYSRVIVFLSDGEPNFEPNTNDIIDSAKKYQIKIYTVTLRMHTPNCLKQISQQTGGEWYEQVNSVNEIISIYIKILHQAQNIYDPCEITWLTEPSCDLTEKNTVIKLINPNTIANISYFDPSTSIIKLIVNPFSIVLKNLNPGAIIDTFITVTAINNDIDISDIISSNKDFSIFPKKFRLKNGDSQKVKVSYTVPDSSYTFSKFDIINNKCQTNFYVTYHSSKKGFINKTLKVIFPNGGETFFAGNDTIVKWDGITPQDFVNIDFSPDNGGNWYTLSNYQNNLTYHWSDIPHINSDSCLIRIRQISTQYNINDTGNTLFSTDNYWVNTVSWSHDGTKLAGGSNDKSIRIWDTKTAKEIKSLIGHNSYLWSLSWNPDDSKIASGGDDGVVRIWDVTQGNILKTLTGHKDSLSWVSWSSDGVMIASGSWDGEIKIWDAIIGKEIKSFFGHNGGVCSVEWSPDGTKLASCGTDKTIKIWDINSGTILQTILGHNGVVRTLIWSPDGNKIVSGGYDSTIRVWDVQNGKEIGKWQTNNLVPSISIKLDGTKLVSGGYGEINVWDLNTTNNIKTISGFNQWAYSVAWSPDGQNVAAATEDFIVRTFPIKDYELQQDVSDSMWSIILPDAISKEINMGKVVVGNTKDSIIVNFIDNIGSAPFPVDSIILQKQNSEFSVINTQIPDVINAGGKKVVTFRFQPNTIGTFKDSIIIINKFSKIKYLIYGEGVKGALILNSDIIDFGYVSIGNEKDTLHALIQNLSDSIITIIKTELLGPDKSQFIIDSGGGSFSLKPREERILKVIFKPTEKGKTSSAIGFFFNETGSPMLALLFGIGLDSTIVLKVGSTEGHPGDTILIPIYLYCSESFIQSNILGFNADLSYNASLLFPMSDNIGVRNDNQRIQNLQIPTKRDTNSIVEILVYKAALGDDSITTLKLENTKSLGDMVEIKTIDGQFKLLGLCNEGGKRLLDFTIGKTSLSICPNPVFGYLDIDFEVIETDNVELYITNHIGQIVKTIINGKTQLGKQTINLNSHNLSPGIYFIILKTSTSRAIRKFIVLE